MFSLSCSGSFTPVYLGWMAFNPSFYINQTSADQGSQEQSKSFFSPILISSPIKMQDGQDQQPLQLQIKASPKNIHIQKCQTQDEEYTPGSGNSKKNKKNQQNQNRNIIPNIVNQILSFIQKRNKSGIVTEKIFERINQQQNWNVKRFYLYQSMLKNKISHYVNEETLKIYMQSNQIDYSIYSKQEQNFYNKVSRILIKHFMQIQAETSTLTSKRMDKSKKAEHIKIQRYLMQKLREHYKLH